MTDQADDTLLDDDVEEHDFNFDNEKEEALLADNEFDAFIEDQQKEKSLDPGDAVELEHLDQEEDVLDIGIAEEDIVENELVSISNTIDNPVDFEPEEKIIESDPTIVTETDVEKCFESEQISNTTDVEKEVENENTLAAGTDIANALDDHEKHVSCEQDEELSAKPTVISLKKHDKKSYDGLPDLAKVIELVQPHGLSRHRKHGRPLQQFAKKTRPSDVMKVNKHGDCHERNDNKCDDNFYRGGKSDFRPNDGSKRSYSNDGHDTSVEMINRSQRVTEMHSSHNFVSEYKNLSSQSLLHRPDVHVERPIVATVQITQERYQIAGDFQIIRPSMENSCQPLIRPFEQNRLFQSRGTLPPSSPLHQMPRATGQFAGNRFPVIRPLMPPPNSNNYNRAALLPPTAAHQMPRRPLLLPSGTGIPPQPIRQRFPSHSGPPMQQNFPPPLMGPNGPPPGPAYHHNYQQPRSQFGLNSAPLFPQNFSRPPPFSQPPPPLSSSNGPYYSGNLSHMPNSGPPAPNPVYQNRPPPPANFQGNFPRMSNEGSHSVVFQQSSQRIIRMPPFSNVNENSQCVMNNSGNVGPPPPGDYYVKESITTTSSTYLPPPVTNQPPPPGVPSYQSAPPVSYSAEDANYPRNNQVEYFQCTRDYYYPDQSSDRYPPYSKTGDSSFRGDAVSLDRDRNSHDLKRSSVSSMDDNVSVKRYRFNYLNNKSNDDANNEEIEYRKKVEDQKKMREKFVQMKEEQRLKNQMQNFIQNNIKGVLQRREQLLKKNETESNTAARFVNVKTKDDSYRLDESNRNRNPSSVGNVTDKSASSISPLRKQFDYKNPPNNTRNWCPSDDARTPPPVVQRFQNNGGFKAKEVTERLKIDDERNDTRSTTKQLHKVVKIKYKDGTVALKSFPVVGPNKRNVSSIEKPNSVDYLNVTIRDEDSSSNSNRRRMIVSKQPSSFGDDNASASSHNENIIVESVRKGVTQSGVPLAQRFSNLKPTQKDENDEDSSVSVGMKSKNRLVVSHEEKMRTVWIKNISPNTKTSLIQKIANTCGTITRMRWITGNAQYNEAKITFSKVDEAKKFIHNYHRKTVDTSLILVTSMTSESK